MNKQNAECSHFFWATRYKFVTDICNEAEKCSIYEDVQFLIKVRQITVVH